jgi:hypothetical protein
MRRGAAFGAVMILLVSACGGGGDDAAPSDADVRAFCRDGIDLVEATLVDPGGDDAVEAFEDLDEAIASSIDLDLADVDPDDVDDAQDIADAFVDAGCDEDGFDDIIDDFAGADTTAVDTTVVETTIPVETTVPSETTVGSETTVATPPPSADGVIAISLVSAGPPPQEAIDAINAKSALTVFNPVEAATILGLAGQPFPLVVIGNGHLVEIDANAFFGLDDSYTSLVATDDPQAVMDEIVAVIQPLGDFDVSTSSQSNDGASEISTELFPSAFGGASYSVTIVTEDDTPGLARIEMERSILEDIEVPPPGTIFDVLNAQVTVATNAGFGEPASWSLTVGNSRFDFSIETYSLNYPDVSGVTADKGVEVCAAAGFEVSSNDEFGVSCSSEDGSTTWSIFDGFDDGTVTGIVSTSFF